MTHVGSQELLWPNISDLWFIGSMISVIQFCVDVPFLSCLVTQWEHIYEIRLYVCETVNQDVTTLLTHWIHQQTDASQWVIARRIVPVSSAAPPDSRRWERGLHEVPSSAAGSHPDDGRGRRRSPPDAVRHDTPAPAAALHPNPTDTRDIRTTCRSFAT